MSSTPLLSAAGGLPGPNVMQDHPAFLRVSHSPWGFIPQNVLVALRGIVLAYLTATAFMIGHHKLTEESEVGQIRHLFDFGLISYGMVTLYHLMTFCWTFTHLYYPDADAIRGGVESLLVRAMSLPSNMGSLRKQFYFTLFYAVTTVFSFMNTAIYWSVTRPHEGGGAGEALLMAAAASDVPTGLGEVASSSTMTTIEGPFSDLFGEGWFTVFVLCNLYGVTSGFMVFETLFLNSTKRPIAIGSHFFGVMFHAGLYLAWAAAGKALTDAFPFFWLDEAEVGSKEAVTAYCMGFVLLSPIMYTLMLGFVGIREGLTRPGSEQAVGEAREDVDN
ncbi:hypothetical protein CDD83_3741 [Cordyceps sp. RAO-2017]|nr:hypothetical protein CDD83_3741 [Cordyceps sp. RAO-2017]